MGYNTVAVILNDHSGDIESSGHVGKRLVSAMRNWFGRRDKMDLYFGAGSVISQDHADGYQVTVVHGNMGWRADDQTMDKYLGRYALDQMKECLERNGYRVTKMRKPQPSS